MCTIGDEVRYAATGQMGIIKGIIYYHGTNEIFMYEVEFDGVVYSVEEIELN